MPPKRNLRPRRPRPPSQPEPTPEASTDGGAPLPPLQLDLTQLQTLMAQTLAAYESTRNNASGNSNNGSGPSGTVLNNPTRSCTYKDFMACKPTNFHGNEGVVGLMRWIEKMETVFRISSCPEESQVKFATCTLLDAALTWWNDHAQSMGNEIAYALDWRAFKQLMIEEYCPRQEVQILEQELWGLTMKGSEVILYTSRFNELANLCPGMVTPEYRKIERYIYGLAQPMRSLVTASRPTTFDSAKRLAYQVTEQCVRDGILAPQTEKKSDNSKRKFQGNSHEDAKHHKSPPEPVAVYAAITNTPTPSKGYVGKAPLCTRCNFHHTGNCLSCDSCNGRGHTSKNCKRTPAPANATTTPAAGGVPTCYECHLPGHFKRDCPKLRN